MGANSGPMVRNIRDGPNRSSDVAEGVMLWMNTNLTKEHDPPESPSTSILSAKIFNGQLSPWFCVAVVNLIKCCLQFVLCQRNCMAKIQCS